MSTTFLVPKNNAASTLNGAVTDVALTWTVADGSQFPSTFPFHVSCQSEIAECTGRTGNVLTVSRGAEGTTPAGHADATVVELLITAAAISELQDAILSLESADHTHNILSTTHGDAVGAVSPVSGALIASNATPAWDTTIQATHSLTYIAGALDVSLEGSPRLSMFSYGTGTNPSVRGMASRGTIAAPTAILSGDVLLSMNSQGRGTALRQGPRISFTAAEDFAGATAHGNTMSFQTVPIGSDTLTVGMTLGSDQVLTLVAVPALPPQTANTVWAGPTSGGAAVPAFRALVSADLPATVVETGDADWIDLTDGGATTLHSHAGGGTHVVLDSTAHTDTLTGTVVDGDIIIGNVTPKWSRLAIAIPAAAVRNVLGIDNGELRPSWKTALDATNPTTIGVSDAAAAGTSLIFAHRDHQHGSPATFTATAHNIFSSIHGDTTGAASPVDGDIIIGNVTPKWSKLAVSVPAANVRNVLGIDNAELRPSWKTALDATNPTTIAESAAASPGTSLVFSHRDHTHGAPATWAATAHNIFSATHGDTTGAASPVDGDIIIGNVTPKWSKLAIAIPAANVRNVLGIDNGEVRPSWKTSLDATAPTTIAFGAAAAAGTSLVFAHRDHTHGMFAQSTLDHGTIGGLTDDDHVGYALLAGRAGGQTLIGGTAANDDLLLQATSHATRTTSTIKLLINDTAGDTTDAYMTLGQTSLIHGPAIKALQFLTATQVDFTNLLGGVIVRFSDATSAGTPSVEFAYQSLIINENLTLNAAYLTGISGGSYQPQYIMRNQADDASASYFLFQKSRYSAGVPQNVQPSDVIGNINMQGYVGGFTAGMGLSCFGEVTAVASPNFSARWRYYTADVGATREAISFEAKGSVVIGGSGGAALATNATDGFLYIPTCAGAPTGTPVGFTGRVAIIYDTTNNNFYAYNGAWKKVAMA